MQAYRDYIIEAVGGRYWVQPARIDHERDRNSMRGYFPDIETAYRAIDGMGNLARTESDM